MKATDAFENRIKSGENINVPEFNSKKELHNLIEKSEYTVSQINYSLGLNSYLYEVLDKKNSKRVGRDVIIRVLIFLHGDIDLCHKILQGFGHSKIYVKIPRDKIIYDAIIHKKSLDELDEILIKNNFEPLTPSK